MSNERTYISFDWALKRLLRDKAQGEDVVYHGKAEFRGIHNHNDVLQLSPFQKQKFKVDEVYQLYPEYYILKVNDFNHWSKVPLEQWLYFLSTSEIPDDADAPGLPEAREKLKFIQMTREEQVAYDRYWMDRTILRNTMITARGEGRLEGHAEGHAEGRKEGLEEGRKEGREEGRIQERMANARKMKMMNIDIKTILQITGLTEAQILEL